MVKIIFIAALFFLLLAACQKKATPVIVSRKAELPQKTNSPYAPEGTVTPDTVRGKLVYNGRCDRCHGLPEIKSYSASRWENALLSMLPRAGVDKTDAVHVRAYVLAVLGK